MTEDNDKLDFVRILKGKKNGGELHGWLVRELSDKDDNILGQIVYGYLNGGNQSWRTSAVVQIHEIKGPHKILETRNTFYTLVGDEDTDEAHRMALYAQFYD